MNNKELCPFSKPILGKWCQCEHAKLTDRCSGKMICTRSQDLQQYCNQLDDAFKINTRFILGVNNDILTHAQLMKIRCGGLLGMKRVLNLENNSLVDIREVINVAIKSFNEIEQFPFSDIIQDIKKFKHR